MSYVCMIDRAMSGWGPARDKKNMFVVHCETEEQRQQIERVAHSRPEMSAIHQRYKRPHNTRARFVTL